MLLRLQLIWLIMLITSSVATRAQQPVPTNIRVVYDSTALPELYDQLSVGLEITFSDGSIKKTEGLLKGNYRWSRLHITSSSGKLENGFLTLDRRQLAQQQYQLSLSVTFPNTDTPLSTTLQLPRLERIRFNHYADSLKRNVHFYLNVEGVFSSGKILPLDTAAVRFQSSTGHLIGQDLLLEKEDTVTRMISLKAISRTDPAISASSVIPVKQLPDDESQIKNVQDVMPAGRNNKRNRNRP
ncbi:hypothetical protein KTO58_18205 [Chitinophaga pendula]|uniref:hypothetical protein n=1 Tax=Chitinophaga TaxID=79328 RepID=UPI000BAE8A34|nr:MULTISPECIES: hypothetical protein [Chitinophaga]ASZ11386.1 hypothetical protein CK934_10610 [Chitinophaga sp. MD30]UCJ05610.1 hypothetical protein KTO58_18205 [Chitinophaga pendula]